MAHTVVLVVETSKTSEQLADGIGALLAEHGYMVHFMSARPGASEEAERLGYDPTMHEVPA